MKKLYIAGAAFAALLASSANAAWIGHTVEGNDAYDFGGGFVYGGGQATTIVPGGNTASGGTFSFAVTDHMLSLTVYGTSFASWPVFNGFSLTDLSADPGITSVTLVSTGLTYTPAALFDSSHIWIDMKGRNYGPSETYQFAVTFGDDPAPTPEPASWAMMVGGFGAIGGAMRSRRKAVASFG